MIHMVLGLAVTLTTPVTQPAGATLAVAGKTDARVCFEAAERRTASLAALFHCDRALAEGLERSERIATHVNRGVLRMILGDHAGAETDFNRALSFDGRLAEAWLNKGISIYQRGDSRAALVHIDKSIAYGTRQPALAYYARGVAREDVGDIRGAYADLKRASELAPTWTEPKAELARYKVRSR